MAEWSDELKASVVKKYEAAEPTAETSTEIVKDIAEALGDGFTVNGVRVILVKAGVYIKKGVTATTTAVAAAELNREWIGIESNKEYINIANKRIREIKAQSNLKWH